MIAEKVLRGEVISLRQIEMGDCTSAYVDWLNDPEVNKYLETRWYEQTLDSVKEFVISQIENDHSYLMAIVLNADNRHIGNIKIGPINKHHKHADLSYFIGVKSLWGKGIATEAINLASGFAFNDLGLHRVEAGAYSLAIGSWKAMEHNGFRREAVFREQAIFNKSYIDIYRYGLLKMEYKPQSKGERVK